MRANTKARMARMTSRCMAQTQQQIITDHGDSLPGLKVVGIFEGTIDNG
jgi:hypothetical protein